MDPRISLRRATAGIPISFFCLVLSFIVFMLLLYRLGTESFNYGIQTSTVIAAVITAVVGLISAHKLLKSGKVLTSFFKE